MEQAFVPTEDKIALVNALSQAGLSKIEVGLCLASAIPALRDGEIVMHEIERRPGTVYTALVPNAQGTERAIEARTDELNLVMSVSETHNLCNLRMRRSQSFAALAQVVATARQAGVPSTSRCHAALAAPWRACATGSLRLGAALADLGVQGVADATGMAFPTQVRAMVAPSQRGATGHDPAFPRLRGMALANVLASIEAGGDRFDASIGGLGGYYAPGASGNACTEDIVHALQLMGYDTGVDLAQIVAAARGLPLIGHEHGQPDRQGRRAAGPAATGRVRSHPRTGTAKG